MDESIPVKGFYGVFIPSQLLRMDGLALSEKIILAAVDTLYEKEEGGCAKSNPEIAHMLGLGLSAVKSSIPRMITAGLIERINFNGRKRVIRACNEKWNGVKRK